MFERFAIVAGRTREITVAVKLRLMRMGKKKQPTYRVVAADARSPRNGRFIEIIGTYEPQSDPSVININNDRAVHWLRHGAQPTDRVDKLLKISGAWESFTGEAAPAVPTRAKNVEPGVLVTDASVDVAKEIGSDHKGQAGTEPEKTEIGNTPRDEAVDRPYGEGSHVPLDDPDEAPDGFEIKGNVGSKLYHTPDSPFYGRTKAAVWFASAAAAEAAGFVAPGKSNDGTDDEEVTT